MIKTRGLETQSLIYWYKMRLQGWNPNQIGYTLPGVQFQKIADESPQFERFGNCWNSEVKLTHVDKLFTTTEVESNGAYALSKMIWPLVSEDTSFNARAFLGMKPGIAPAVQAPLELKEFVLGWRALLAPSLKKPSIFSKAGNVNLWWQFGVAPTIGAIQDSIEGLKAFDRRLSDFLRLQGKPLVSHFCEVEEISDQSDITDEYTDAEFSHKCWSESDKFKVTRVATMKYKYTIIDVEKYKKETIRLLALGDLFGVSRISAMAWEATPWSFVVDWFFTVGEFLEQFDKPFLDTSVEVLDYCISTKFRYNGRVYFSRGLQPRQLVGTYSKKYYHRSRCLPDYQKFGIRESGNFGPRQFFLGLSLLVA